MCFKAIEVAEATYYKTQAAAEEAKSGIRPKAEFVISAGDVIRNVDEALQPQRRLVTLLGRHVTLTAATEEVKESRALAEEVPKAVG